MSMGINLLHFMFQDVLWVSEWLPVMTILYIIILVDLLFWMAGMQLAEDYETNMIQVMRTSRSITSYFFSKHVLLLLFVSLASLLVVMPNISSPIFIGKFVYLTFILSLIMIGCGILITMVFKKQSILMIAGSIVTGLIFLSVIRLIFPTWNIESISFNPFEYFVSAYYNLYLPAGSPVDSSLSFMTIFSIAFYLLSIYIFHVFTFKKGFRL